MNTQPKLQYSTKRFDMLREEAKSPEAVPSVYLKHLKKVLKKTLPEKVVLYIRASARSQNRRENLENQKRSLRRKLKKRGVLRTKTFWEIGSGTILARPGLKRALRFARKYGYMVVVESTDRLIRNRWYKSTNQQVKPTELEFQGLMELAEGVTLVTLLHPDASLSEQRSHQTKRGMKAKGGKPGRPPKHPQRVPKKERRLRDREKVLQLHKKGWPLREITAKTGIPKSTVNDWIKKT